MAEVLLTRIIGGLHQEILASKVHGDPALATRRKPDGVNVVFRWLSQ